MSVYSATKGAIISFTKALAKEVSDKNVLVNCISPGSVSNNYDEKEPSELSFIGRTGTHSENAKLICFLVGDDASYISGQNIRIEGNNIYSSNWYEEQEKLKQNTEAAEL